MITVFLGIRISIRGTNYIPCKPELDSTLNEQHRSVLMFGDASKNGHQQKRGCNPANIRED